MQDKMFCERCRKEGVLYFRPRSTLHLVLHGSLPEVPDQAYELDILCARCGTVAYTLRGHLSRPPKVSG